MATNKACAIGRQWEVPILEGMSELFALKVSLQSTKNGKVKPGEKLPTSSDNDFWIVGTDIEAIKTDVCDRIDYLFKLGVD